MYSPTLRDRIKSDTDKVIMNTVTGVARICKWNGRDLRVVTGQISTVSEEYDDGRPAVLIKTMSVRIFEGDLEHIPKPTQSVNLDGETWYVNDITPSIGDSTITLARRLS